MGTDADDNFWPQSNGTSAMTTSIIPHHFGYGRVARRCRAIPKILDNWQNPARMASNPWKIDQMLRQAEIDLGKATAHAGLALRRNPSGGYRLKSGHRLSQKP